MRSRRGGHRPGESSILRLLRKVLPYSGLNEVTRREREGDREVWEGVCLHLFHFFLLLSFGWPLFPFAVPWRLGLIHTHVY